jgi:hypothetical protein
LAQVVADASPEKAYVHELQLLQSLPGPRDYVAALFQRPVVQKDQWEVEMWRRVLEQVGGPAGLIYCTTDIPPGDLEKLPLTSGYTYTGESRLDLMVQRAIQRTLPPGSSASAVCRALGLSVMEHTLFLDS